MSKRSRTTRVSLIDRMDRRWPTILDHSHTDCLDEQPCRVERALEIFEEEIRIALKRAMARVEVAGIAPQPQPGQVNASGAIDALAQWGALTFCGEITADLLNMWERGGAPDPEPHDGHNAAIEREHDELVRLYRAGEGIEGPRP